MPYLHKQYSQNMFFFFFTGQQTFHTFIWNFERSLQLTTLILRFHVVFHTFTKQVFVWWLSQVLPGCIALCAQVSNETYSNLELSHLHLVLYTLTHGLDYGTLDNLTLWYVIKEERG